MHTPKVLLITGGAGFIGSNFVRYILAHDPAVRVINLDALTYAGSLANLTGIEQQNAGRYVFIHGNTADQGLVAKIFAEMKPDTVVHLAAESHVDRSIDSPLGFVDSNVKGTVVLLQAAGKAWKGRADVRFHHVSTDEVYGSLGPGGLFTEGMPYNPSNPYSASKAAADLYARVWSHTYGLPLTLSHCSNNYGPHQFPEKLIPLMIMLAMDEKPLPIYGDGGHVRDWLHVEDHCRAIDLIVRKAAPGAVYHVGGKHELANIDVVRTVCAVLMDMKPRSSGHYWDLIKHVEDRPGHDRRYAMNIAKIQRELGWQPVETFPSGLRKTVQWYLDHQDWIKEICAAKYSGVRLGTL